MRIYDDDYLPRSGRYSDGYSDGRFGKPYSGNYGEKAWAVPRMKGTGVKEHQKQRDSGFPFRMLRLLGWALLVLGVIVLMLGVINVGWTAGNYIGTNCPATNQNFDKTGELKTAPCDHKVLTWTWVAAAIWASFFVIITGIIGTRFSSWRSNNLKFHRDLFAIMCILVCLIWGPVIIIISSLELVYGKDVFYYIDNNNVMKFGDMAKVIIPLLIIAFTFFFWMVAIVGAIAACCCAPLPEYGYDSFPRRSMRSYRSALPPTSNMISTRSAPTMGPPIVLPPTTGYSSFPGYATYGGMRSGYTNYGYSPASFSGYGNYGNYGGYSSLSNALMPYTGNYGGATYGGYGTRAIASNPYI